MTLPLRMGIRTGGVLATVAAITVLTGCASRQAAPVVKVTPESWSYEGREGRKYVTEHFEIYTTLADRELEEALPAYLEAAHRQYTAMLPAPSPADRRLQTYVFNSRSEWERFSQRRFPRRFAMYRRIGAGGYAEGDLCVVYYIRRPYTLSVLAHEGMHQYFASHFDVPLPAWLNEGMATYCESFELPRGKPVFTPTRNTFRLNAVRESLTTRSVIPLREILATNAGKVINEGQSRLTKTYYAQVWALVTYLQHGENGRYRQNFDRLLQSVVDGDLRQLAQAAKIRAPQPAKTSYGEAVFRAFISEDFETFEAGFRAYMMDLAGFRDPGA